MTRVVVVGRRRLLEHGQERHIHHTCPAVTEGEGETVETIRSRTAVRAWRAERRGCSEAREVGALWSGRPGIDGYILCGGVVPRSATWPSEPAEVPPSPAAKAGAEKRWAVLPAAFTWPVAVRGWRRRRWGYRRDWPHSEMGRRSSSQKRGIGSLGWRWCERCGRRGNRACWT